jgi:heptosyltransferase-2
MKVLVIQQRYGIGDMVILLPYIHAISKKFNTPVGLLAKETSKASDLLAEDKHVDEVINLDKEKDGINGFFKLSSELKKRNFDKAFIFNNSLRYNLVAKFSGIKSVHQYPLYRNFIKKDNLVLSAKNFTESITGKDVSTEPSLKINRTNDNVDKSFKHICLAVSASGPTKRWDINNYIRLAQELVKTSKCKFYIAAGPNDIDLIKKFKDSDVGNNCESFEKLSIRKTLPIIKNCNLTISGDTGFAHIACALGVKTLTLFMDSPVMTYGKYSSKMSVIEPEGLKNQTVHNTLGKDSISFAEVLNKAKELLV